MSSRKSPLLPVRNTIPPAVIVGVFVALVACSIALADETAATSPVSLNASGTGGVKATGTVIMTNINTTFHQTGGSCVLASYAIVASYFTGEPVSAFFEAYCRHFKINFDNALDAELKYAIHFDAEWKKRNCLGYHVILDLHTNSMEKCFVAARSQFDPQFYRDSAAHLTELEEALRTREAMLNITYATWNDAHSVTVIRDGDRWVLRDTNRRGLQRLDKWDKLGKLMDCVLYVRKQ